MPCRDPRREQAVYQGALHYEVDRVIDPFRIARHLVHAPVVNKIRFLRDACRGKRVLDLGCVRHTAAFALKDPHWLHGIIASVAATMLGVDIVAAEVEKLCDFGYNVIAGDVTKPIPIAGPFDVIVAGDIIEHLDNFAGFFENCQRLLAPDGIVVITTANPFYAELFHYIALKRAFLANPEHSCWIDPCMLARLAARFGFRASEMHYLTNSWRLRSMICETASHRYDIVNDRWSSNTLAFRACRKIMKRVFGGIYDVVKILSITNTRLVQHADYLAVLRREPATGGVP